MMIPEEPLLVPRAIQTLQDRFHCDVTCWNERRDEDDETCAMDDDNPSQSLLDPLFASAQDSRRCSISKATHCIQTFILDEENLKQKSSFLLNDRDEETEYDLFTQCVIVACGSLSTYIAITQNVLRSESLNDQQKNKLLHYVIYHAFPMLLFHPSKVTPVDVLIETDNTPSIPYFFSIWYQMRSDSLIFDRNSKSSPTMDVNLYQNVITNIIALPSVLRNLKWSMDPIVALPKWMNSEYTYLTQLMSCCLSSVVTMNTNMTCPVVSSNSCILFRTLVRQLLRRRNGYFVAASICSFYFNECSLHAPDAATNQDHGPLGQRLFILLFPPETSMLPTSLSHHCDTTYLSNREAAILYRCILRYILSAKQGIDQANIEIVNEEDWNYRKYVARMIDLCHPLLQRYAMEICHLVVLSSSSVRSNAASLSSSKRLCHILALHLSQTTAENQQDHRDSLGGDDDDSVDEVSDRALDLEIPKLLISPKSSEQCSPSVLYHHLCDVAHTWAQLTFIHHTENGLQQHVTGFLHSGLSILIQMNEQLQSKLDQSIENNAVDSVLFYTTLSMHLLEGITIRLGSLNDSLRRDGMEIGELVATLLGQPSLTFEELHVGTPKESKEKAAPNILERSSVTNDDHADEDSEWEEDSSLAERYDVEDDRLDLLTTPHPLYLSECLDYLHTPETDENIGSRHESVLQHVSALVRARPADLNDYSAELARSILRLENKYNIHDFSKLIGESMCSLVVEDPVAVGTNLIAELFEDGSLRDRLTILHALDEAAFELSGHHHPENKNLEGGQGLPPLDVPRISGKREVLLLANSESSNRKSTDALNSKTLEERTQRWGKCRHPEAKQKRLENRFSLVAPEWFYLLLGRFVHCKDNTTLWGGDVGATLLSSLFLTLSRILTCTGPYTPGVDVLAKDLWELVWSFRMADVSQVRISVLYAVGAAIGFLREDTMVALLLDSSQDNLITNIQSICDNDPDMECRALANQLRFVVVASLKAMDQSLLLIESR